MLTDQQFSNLKILIDELNSGNYDQCFNHLTVGTIDEPTKYCILGICCKIDNIPCVRTSSIDPLNVYIYAYELGFHRHTVLLPKQTATKFGFQTENHLKIMSLNSLKKKALQNIPLTKEEIKNILHVSFFMIMNDIYKVSFSEFATILSNVKTQLLTSDI